MTTTFDPGLFTGPSVDVAPWQHTLDDAEDLAPIVDPPAQLDAALVPPEPHAQLRDALAASHRLRGAL